MDHIPHAVRLTADGVSFGVMVGTVAGWLPSLAAALSVVWLGVQLYDRFHKGPRE